MSYKQLIDELKPYDYSRYSAITSNEKLMIFAAYTLDKKNIPLTFNYICIASFKLFPEKFCCDEEFKEFPSVDRLNRTMMHLKYVQNSKALLVGTVDKGYKITGYGKASAIEVESIINNSATNVSIKAPVVDKHKRGVGGDYKKLINTTEFIKYKETKTVNKMFVWSFFGAIPFTQIKTIKSSLSEVKKYAKELGDEDCLGFIKKIEETI